jgi:hypothetical protein
MIVSRVCGHVLNIAPEDFTVAYNQVPCKRHQHQRTVLN